MSRQQLRLDNYLFVLASSALIAACGHHSGSNGNAAAPLAAAPTPDQPLPACQRTIAVAGTDVLAPAIDGAQAGDCLVLADGDYTFPVISKRGSADRPIVIRAQNRGKAVAATGDIQLRGAAHVVVEGLLFTSSGGIEIHDSEHCRITRLRIRPAEVKDRDWITIAGTSHHVRIDHNDLGPKSVVGNMVMVAGTDRQIAQYNRIDHNFFHDITYGGGNGWETIRLGLSGLAPSSGFNVVELNLFRGASGDPETISVKSSDNIIRHNTYRATNGEITLRHGNRNQVYGNHMLADGLGSARGIRVLGADHKIFDNTFVGIHASPAVLLRSGTHPETDANGREFYRVYRAQVVNNTMIDSSGITIGGRGPLPPQACVVANNHFQNAPAKVDDQGEGTKVEGNAVATTPTKGHPLTESDVGPDAP